MGGLSIQDRILSEDATERWCPCCESWKPLGRQHFYVASNTKAGFRRTCKACQKLRDARNRHLEYNGYVYMNKIRPWLRALVDRYSFTKAAEILGVSKGQLAGWLNKHRHKIQRRNAARILRVCADSGVYLASGQGKSSPRGSQTWAVQTF